MRILRFLSFRLFCLHYHIPATIEQMIIRSGTRSGYMLIQHRDEFVGFSIIGHSKYHEVTMPIYFDKRYKTEKFAKTAALIAYRKLRNGGKYNTKMPEPVIEPDNHDEADVVYEVFKDRKQEVSE